MKDKLCIFVPTYHRAQLLERCLDSIILECTREKSWYKKVGIFVSNNDKSDNDTKKVVMKMQQKYPIAYHENDSNLGIDGNMRIGFEINNCFFLGGGEISLLSNAR